MDTFAETAIVNYRLSFVDQGKTNFSFPFSVFCLQQTNGFFCLPFLFSICSKQTKIAISS
jgi:hypothetical protein